MRKSETIVRTIITALALVLAYCIGIGSGIDHCIAHPQNKECRP
jgi:hypothetical protein